MILIFPLLSGLKKKSGRNNNGKIILSYRGGGGKRLFKLLDYKRYFFFEEYFKVIKIFKDVVKNLYLAILVTKLGFFSYIVSPVLLFENQFVITSNFSLINIGNKLSLKNITAGQLVHHIELSLYKGGQLIRASGSFGQKIKQYSNFYSLIKLKSKELRLVYSSFFAVLGVIGNSGKQLEKKVKAGENRWIGVRPRVRGVAMNPVDHPHGGGEGKTSGGRLSVSRWGWLTKGKKLKKIFNKYIIKSRC